MSVDLLVSIAMTKTVPLGDDPMTLGKLLCLWVNIRMVWNYCYSPSLPNLLEERQVLVIVLIQTANI